MTLFKCFSVTVKCAYMSVGSGSFNRALADQKLFFPDGLCCEQSEILAQEMVRVFYLKISVLSLNLDSSCRYIFCTNSTQGLGCTIVLGLRNSLSYYRYLLSVIQ